MNELIAIAACELSGETVPTVNARDLHAFLGVARDFNQWMREQIERARLVENRDYLSYEDVGNPSGGRRRKEHALTLDAGKHIAMMSGTEKGFEVREYFIACERRAKSKPRDPLEVLNDPSAMRGLLLTYSEKVLASQGEVDAMRPDVEALERIARAEGSFNITLAAKTLQLQPKLLFQWLSRHRWIYRRAGGKCWIGYQDKIEAGLIEHKTTTFSRTDGSDKTVEQVLITPKGLTKLARIFAQLPLSDFPPAFYGGSQALAH